jgi:uncharacterized membrane protein YtjA (UPF0391 family)
VTNSRTRKELSLRQSHVIKGSAYSLRYTKVAAAITAAIRNYSREADMLYWAAVFLVIAIVAGVLGFGGIAGTATEVARVLFVVFLVLFLAGIFLGWRAV